MKGKFILFMFGLFLAIALVSAVFYPEPWGNDVDAGNYNLNNVNNVTANNFIGSFVGDIDSVNWTKLKNYPVACPGSGAITTLDDSVTCSDLWFDVAGNETITGNMTFSGAGILNLSFIESLDWTNITLLESQISNLAHTINGTNIDVLDINASSATIHGDVNMSGGNLTLMDKITFRFGEIIDNLVDGWIEITGNLKVAGDLNVTGNITAISYYGEMWMQNISGYATTAIASSDVWYNLTGFNDTEMVTGQSLNGFTYDNANEHLTALIAGKYKVMYSVSNGNAGNNQEYEFAIAINGIIQNNTVTHRKIQTNGDVGNTAGSGFIDIAVDDSIHLMVLDRDGTADIQAHAMNLNLLRIGS